MLRSGFNLLTPEPLARGAEVTQQIATGNGMRLERIVSHGQASPEGFWYDQTEAEWVTVLTGRTRIRLAEQASSITLGPGDTLYLPAHCRHRVEWTDPDQPTVWLAVFVDHDLKVLLNK